MIIETKLDVAHLELIKIFLKANDLVGIIVSQEPMEYNGRFHMVLHLEPVHEPAAVALTFLGLRHSGVLNMLDDYLIKCGVDPHDLQPKTYLRQLQEEKEAKQNEDFMKRLLEIKEKNEHTNQ